MMELNGKPAIIYSAEDLSAGLVGQPVDGIVGYTPQVAWRLMANIIQYAMGESRWILKKVGKLCALRFDKMQLLSSASCFERQGDGSPAPLKKSRAQISRDKFEKRHGCRDGGAARRNTHARFAQLLAVSSVDFYHWELFAVAAYLFIDPKPGF